MSNSKIKKEFLILGAIIVVILGYLLFKQSDKVHYQLPSLDSVKAETLTKIEVKGAEKSFTLAKKDGKWVIDPQGYPTDEEKVKKITGTVSGLTLSELASKAKSYIRYGLDKEKVIKVKAYKDSDVVREFEIGKEASTRNHTFVKLKDDTNVYQARENFRRDFDTKIDDLRDKLVLNVDKNEVSEIEVTKGEENLFFTKSAPEPPKVPTPLVNPVDDAKKDAKDKEKKPEAAPPVVTSSNAKPEPAWMLKDGTEGNKGQLEGILGQLTSLKCDSFLDDKKKGELKEPIFTLRVKGRKDYTLTIYDKIEIKEKEDDPGTSKYPAISSENPYPFLLNTYKAEQIMKKPEELKKAVGSK